MHTLRREPCFALCVRGFDSSRPQVNAKVSRYFFAHTLSTLMDPLFKIILGFIGTIVIFGLLIKPALKIKETEDKGSTKLEKNLSMYILIVLVILSVFGSFISCGD